MSKCAKILTFAGSVRKDSMNKMLAKLAAKIVTSENAEANFVDLADYPLPLYDGDYEAKNDYPKNAEKLKALFKEHDGFLIASPEYNSSITALLKNTIDWLSRSESKGTDLTPFTGKVIAVVSTSPGNLGGMRGLVHIRSIMSNLGSFVIPNQIAIPRAFTAFDEDGNLTDAKQLENFANVVKALVDSSKRFKIDLNSYCKQLYEDFSFKE